MSVRDDAPPRPGIPLVLVCALALWAGALAGRELCAPFGSATLIAAAVALGMASAGLGVHAIRREGHGAAPALAALFCALGLAASLASLAVLDHTRTELLESSGAVCRFQVVEDPSESTFGESAVLRVVREGSFEVPGSTALVRAYFDGDAPALGQELEAEARFFAPSDAGRAYYDRKGIACRAELGDPSAVESSSFGALASLRASFASTLDMLVGQGGIDEQAGALVRALVVGDRGELFATSLYQEVKVTGLAHLVAVSGAHLVIVTGFVKVLLDALRLPQRVRLGAQIAFVFVYVVMVGFPVSCLRAAAMSVVSAFSLSVSRRSHALSSLGVAVIAIIGVDPAAASSLSFALSVLATLGIVLLVPLFFSWCPDVPPRIKAWVVDPIAMTAAATMTTFPLSMSQFAQFPLVAPVSNVVASPLVSLICGVGVLAFVAQPVPALSSLLLQAACGAGWLFVRVVDALSRLPFAAIPVDAELPAMAMLSVVAVALLWIMWPRRVDARVVGVGAACATLCLVVALIPRLGSEMIMLDVGQGDAFVVRSQGRTMLVDTGNEPTKLYEGLARHGVRRLDAVVVSHADDDHCACLADLVGIVPCEAVYVSNGMCDSEADKPHELVADAQCLAGEDRVRELQVGTTLSIGNFTARVLSPAELTEDGGNADSLCLLLEFPNAAGGAWTALMCGDAEAEVLDGLVEAESLGQVDLYKVGHHGARAALDEELAQTLSPQIALVSVGADNTYGHPNEETLALLERVGAQTFCSDEVGDVVCSFSPERIEVTPMR